MSKTIDDSDDSGIVSGDLVASGNVTAGLNVSATAGIFSSNVTANGLLVQTSGGTPTLFNYYEEYNMTSTFTGCGQTTISTGIKFTRVGRVVTCSVETISFTAATAGVLISATEFPARFNSSDFTGNQHFAVNVVNAGTQMLADAYINYPNQIILTGSPAGGNFAIGSATVFKFATSWTF